MLGYTSFAKNFRLSSRFQSRYFRAEKRTAQLSAHPQLSYLRVQVIMQAVMVCNAWKTAVDCNKVSEDVVNSVDSVIYTWASMKIFFRHFTFKKTSLPLPAERLSS